MRYVFQTKADDIVKSLGNLPKDAMKQEIFDEIFKVAKGYINHNRPNLGDKIFKIIGNWIGHNNLDSDFQRSDKDDIRLAKELKKILQNINMIGMLLSPIKNIFNFELELPEKNEADSTDENVAEVGLEASVLKNALNRYSGIELEHETGSREQIDTMPDTMNSTKRELFEALQRDELPNSADRAIIGLGNSNHFVSVRRLQNGQWVLLDSLRERPIVLEGGLKNYLSENGFFEILYCKNKNDQSKLEQFILAQDDVLKLE